MKINKLFKKICKENSDSLLTIYKMLNNGGEEFTNKDYLYYLHHYIPEVYGLKTEKPFGVLLKADEGEFCIQLDEDGKDIVFRLMEVCYSNVEV